MINLKTKEDIKGIREAIRIGEVYLWKIRKYIKPGITTLKLNNIIEKWIKRPGATPSFKGYNGFPYATCISINEEVVHGLPSDRKIQEGDVVKIDIGVKYNDYYSDQADTIVVRPWKDKRHVVQAYATQLALERAIKKARVGNNLNDIAKVIELTANEYGFGILKDYTGHGVGLDVHEAPRVFNRPCLANDIKLKKGMVIAIEPMFTSNLDGSYKRTKDGTAIANGIGTHFERTVVVK